LRVPHAVTPADAKNSFSVFLVKKINYISHMRKKRNTPKSSPNLRMRKHHFGIEEQRSDFFYGNNFNGDVMNKAQEEFQCNVMNKHKCNVGSKAQERNFFQTRIFFICVSEI